MMGKFFWWAGTIFLIWNWELAYASRIDCSAISTEAQPPVQTVLQRFELPETMYHQNGLSRIQFSNCAIKPRHQHTGPEVVYALKGEIHFQFEGGDEKIIRAGESFQVPPHVFHVTQAGSEGATVLATWILK